MSEAYIPQDEAIRKLIRERVDLNMCVEAGAGTGKTSVLVDRIVHVLASGHAKVQNVAVITFTEKAAAELSARVRQGLDAALRDTEDGDTRRRLDDAIRGLNQAHIETIHAFAAGLLRERPVEANLDPGFQVLTDLPAQLDFETAYDEWLTQEMMSEPPPAALLDALNLDLEFRLVREAADILQRQRDLLPLPEYDVRPVDAAALVDRIAAELVEVRHLAPRPGVEDQAHNVMLGVCDLLDELELLLGRPEALRRAIVTAQVPAFNKGSQRNWTDPAHTRAVKAALTAIRDGIDECRREMRGAATAELLRWLQGFVAYYERKRQAEGKADFEDLLLWARNLVRDRAEVRRYFQSKYDCILVDEFQDTDPLQVELIVYLCADGDPDGDWRKTKLRPGSLFVVGDPKQSIYRFRRADIAMYDAVKRDLFGGELQEITQNFRSVEPVIAWVNATFSALVVEEPGTQPRYISLLPLPQPAPAKQEAVTLLRGTVPGGGAPIDVRRAEAEALASLILRDAGGGAWRVREGREGATRVAEYRDVAVLIPTRSDLWVYEEAFARAGVPYRHEGGRSFFQRQEVRELVAVLRAIDDPADAVAAVAALRSSAFGLSDEDLFLYRGGGGRFDYQTVRADDTSAVAGALRLLHEFARKRHDTPLPEQVRAVLDRTRLVEFAMLQPQGEQVAANLLKVIDQARAFADASGGGLRGFVRWLKENIVRVADETDAAISEETDNVVRIITIHASKGLEFPIVVFANMNTKRPDRSTVIADRTGAGHLHIKLGEKKLGFQTPGYEDCAAAETAHAAAEDLRLLYVAATRAKDRLLIPFFTAPDARKFDGALSLNDHLREAGADEGDGIDAETLPPLEQETPVWRRVPQFAEERDVRRVIEDRDAWKAAHEMRIGQAGAGLRYHTASGLKPEWARPSQGEGDVRRGRAADFGSAVHALLERIDLSQPDEAAALSRVVSAEFGLLGREGEIEQVARKAMASAVIREALGARRILREVPFTVALPESEDAEAGIAEGRIDLLFEAGGEIVIVDFKTDDVSAAEADIRANEVYLNQALVYAWAAHRATDKPVREVVFVFARPGTESRIAADAAFMAEAEALLREPAAASG